MNNILTLEELVEKGIIEMSRGEVISKNDTRENPGKYPIYSSSVQNEGLFAYYGKFMFDEELVSWSVDGGGDVFYRPKHKFSITNVSGYIRVLRKDILDTKYLAFSMISQKRKHSFDYSFKAHPSVIAPLYSVNLRKLEDQKKIIEILSNMDDSIKIVEKGIEHSLHLLNSVSNYLFDSVKTTKIMSDICKVKGGKRVPKGSTLNKDKTPYPYLRVADMVPYGVVLNDIKFLEEKDFLKIKNYRITSEDLFISVAGTLGIVGQVPKELDGINLTENANKLVILDKKKTDVNYLNFYLNSESVNKKIVSLGGGTGVPKLALEKIEKIEVKIPDQIQEQILISKQIKTILDYRIKQEELLLKLKNLKAGLLMDLI